jgi:hypothetical protein
VPGEVGEGVLVSTSRALSCDGMWHIAMFVVYPA